MIRFLRSLASFARSFLSIAAPAVIFAIHLAVMLCFINRWDSLVTITLIPIWVWAGLGMGLSLVCWFIVKSRLLVLTFVIWMATGIFCADESPGLYRAFRLVFTSADADNGPDEKTNRLRVATINCAGGQIDAAEAVGVANADIVFLQEAPEDDPTLEKLTGELFDGQGSFLRSGPCVILARGALKPVEFNLEMNGLIATLEIPGKPPVDLLNLHLQRAVPRKDFWNPNAWRTFTAIRRSNRRALRKAVELLPSRPAPAAQVIGGDFGTPANDDIYRMLRSLGYGDSFRNAGVGWGNTYTRRQPLIRIDQIWSSGALEPAISKAVVNSLSDHRMVVTDYEWSGPAARPTSP